MSDDISPNVINQENPNNDYWASQIKVLEWLEPVRQRPWMYIWSTDVKWLHHMVYEIVDNWVDEALAWFCKNITVIIHKDWYITVIDDGRWIPVDKHPKTGKSALETVFTILHAWGKFDKWVYKVSWWLHWVWASVVNALSEKLIASIHRDKRIYQQTYALGIPQWDIEIVWETDITGTFVKFKADKTIFETTEFTYSTLSARLKHSAYLTPWVTFTISDERTWQKERFYYEWGIQTWLNNLVWDQKVISPMMYTMKEWSDILMEASFQFVNSSNDYILSFVNNIHTMDWWTHLTWFKNALLKVINELSEIKQLTDKKIWEYQISDIVDGLYAIISIKIPEPQFEWQTKWKLWNSYVRKEVERLLQEYLIKYFEENEEVFKNISEKILLSARARMAAKLAKETVLRKSSLLSGVLPGKLSDCSIKSRHGTELFIVEGNSAGWSAKQWRDSKFQAILPLKGKILNTEQVSVQRILANAEVKTLVMAIWAWLKETYDEEKLRYDKVIIMTDADVDGAHIRTLLLTFFFRYMKPLIEEWHLYIAMPPLYKFTQWKKQQYIYPPNYDINHALKVNWFWEWKTDIQRYKWLGEMNPEQLWETTMNPETRMMQIVTIEDAENADRLFRVLMWEDVLSRKNFILTHAKSVKELDV